MQVAEAGHVFKQLGRRVPRPECNGTRSIDHTVGESLDFIMVGLVIQVIWTEYSHCGEIDFEIHEFENAARLSPPRTSAHGASTEPNHDLPTSTVQSWMPY